MACVPFMMLGAFMLAKFQSGMTETEENKEANLLAGDTIINYRTVASFGNEEQIVQDYAKMLDKPLKNSIRRNNILGFIFGFSQFVQYGVDAII